MVNSSENLPDLENSDSFESDDSENEEIADSEELTKCLFCEKMCFNTLKAVEHLGSTHNFDLRKLKERFQMDQYDFIKMVNYIRIEKPSSEDIIAAEFPLWKHDKYLKPLMFEPWLSFDFEELVQVKSADADPKQMIADLLKELKRKDALLEQAYNDIKTMKESYKRLVEEEPIPSSRNCVSAISLKSDQGYFSSYDHYGIHYEMLSDKVRTESYRDSLLKNSSFIKDKLVLDLGCGTSILSMFASQAGAKEVVSIDNSDIIFHAMDIVEKNRISNINFVKGRLEDSELPVEKFDIIVSEWMGYFLFFEGMLDSVIYAREKHLKPGGTLLPNKCNISLIGHGDLKFHSKYIQFWNDVYGFNMSGMINEILREPVIEIMDPKGTLTAPTVIVEYDLNTVDLNYSNFSFNFKMKCLKDGTLTSFVGYFDIFFDLENNVEFSTGPESTPTHWKQVAFLLDKPVKVKKDEIIDGKIACIRSKNCARSLDIKISVFNKEYKYFLD